MYHAETWCIDPSHWIFTLCKLIKAEEKRKRASEFGKVVKSNSVPIRWECVWKYSPHRRSDTRLIITLHFTPSWVKFHHILCLLLCLWCLEPFPTLIKFWRHNLNIQRRHLTALSCAECIDSCLFAHPADLIPDWLPSFSTLDSKWYLMVYHLLCLFFLQVWYSNSFPQWSHQPLLSPF